MSHRLLFIGVAISILLCSVSARSQNASPLRGLSESEAAALRKKAVELLESVAGQVDSLRSAENRARIGSNVAELLWKHNERRSRTLFAAVAEDIKTGFNQADSSDEAQRHTLMVFAKLRSDTLGRISKHDPELALEFLQATRPGPDVQLPPQVRAAETSLELRLASQIAARNSQLALKLARGSLGRGFSDDLVSVLSQLWTRDKEAFLSFYKELVDKLRVVELARDDSALHMALSLARAFQPPEADEMVYRDLIGLLLTSALSSRCGDGFFDDVPQICLSIGPVYSRMERYYGSRAVPLKRWAGDMRDFGPPPVLLQEAIEKGTVDEILALAPKYPEMQTRIYWSAMSKAEASGDIDRARKIASSFPDENQRRYMLAQIDRGQRWKVMNAEKLAEIQNEVSLMRNNEQRLGSLLYLASQIGANDPKAATVLLNQAGQIIDSTKPGKAQLSGQVGLATVYCSVKSERAFTIMESLMPRLNELVAAAAVLDGLENNYLRDGEWNMTGEGVVGGLLTHLAQSAGCFAVMDFDRSATMARQFDRSELRLMAQLRLAQGVLTDQPITIPMFR